MFELNNICPYTGLRSFNEEESLYFEGREKQITEITKLLEKNKFLMVTGASGDGKSSIVYAGIIPNARAGFFKAKFPKWVIADFRPEKSPLKNFAQSLSKALHVPNPESVETEIKRGFSSLIDLYKNSVYYIDETSQEWHELNDNQRKEKIKTGANLMILVDQFEEFFTTKENFQNGTPSQNSQVTLNLILETAKISLKEDIPIYVICTMRSDFIGQCSAFRGLPEYIGFSQFFVPRLKRNQLQEVIENPAALSGNEISRRLVERLIYDLNEGIDQLPILQHALNQIWHSANLRQEKMDLIHYAMAGGMPADELPVEDQEKFNKWFEALPKYQKKSYDSPSLENVLDIHANRLYEGASKTYNDRYPDHPIHSREAKRAIALTFASLSKIDEGRGVRNRMTLQEITNIINNPNLDTTTTGRLLNIFRQEGNTFIRPFIKEDEENLDLDPDSVLDITHESLIRNWKKLKDWACKESEYYDTFLDFKKQLDRWIESNKSGNYLLPIGPLGYFEKWWEECKPNVHWINRYQDSIEDPQERLNSSAKILDDANAFLNKSAKKHFLPKLFMKYGAGKIGIALAIILTIALSSFYYTDALKKQNDRVIEKVYSTAEKYINNEELLLDFNRSKANFLRTALVHDPSKTLDIIRNIEDPRLKLEIPIETYKELLLYAPKFPGYEVDSLISIIDQNILDVSSTSTFSPGQSLRNLNLYITLLGHNSQFRPSEDIIPSLTTQTERLFQLIIKVLSDSISTEPEISELIFKGIQHINNFSSDPKTKLRAIIPLISPFEDSGINNFNNYFPKGANMSNGGDRLSHLGAHHLMAEVYASLGDQEKIYLAIDELIQNNNAFTYTYELSFNSIYQIYGYLLKNNHQNLTDNFLNYIKTTFNIDRLNFILSFLDRAGYHKHFHLTNFRSEYNNNAGKVNPILSHLPIELMHSFFDFSMDHTGKIDNQDERNFYQAVLLKNKALFTNKYLSDKGETIPVQTIDQWLTDAFEAYEKIGNPYLQEEKEWSYRYFGTGQRKVPLTNQAYFLYPDVFTGFNGNKYLNGYFIEFLNRNPKLLSFYNSKETHDLLIDWVHHGHEYFFNMGSDLTRMVEDIELTHLETIYDLIQSSGHIEQLDLNLLNLIMSNHYYSEGEVNLGNKFYKYFDFSSAKSSAARFEYLNATFLYNELVKSASYQAISGNKDEVEKVIEFIPQDHHKIKSYLIIAQRVHNSNLPENSFHYIRKAYELIDAADQNVRRFRWQYFRNIVETLSEIGSKDLDKLVDEELRSRYPSGTQDKIMGLIKRDKYYQAFNAIPPSNTMMDDLNNFETFMIEANDNLDLPKWKGYKDLIDRYGFMSNNYVRFVE